MSQDCKAPKTQASTWPVNTTYIKTALVTFFLLAALMKNGVCQDVSFTGYFLYQSQSSRVFDVKTGDLDMDNNLDILFTEPDRTVLQWLRNDNNGLFSPGVIGDFAILDYYYSMAVESDGKKKMEEGRWTDIVMKQSGKWFLIGDNGGESLKNNRLP